VDVGRNNHEVPTINNCLDTFDIAFGTEKDFLTVHQDTTDTHKFGYVIINQSGDTVMRLDTAKYYTCFGDTIQYFAIVGLKNKKGWWAIDRNENLLFEVYNTSYGEPSPDELTNGMIRIVDKKGKIGFANFKGKIVIKPQFEAATTFYKGKAIVGRQCKQVLWCCKGDNADKHYLTKCTQTGYIDKKGQVKEMGDYTLEQMQKKLNWPPGD